MDIPLVLNVEKHPIFRSSEVLRTAIHSVTYGSRKDMRRWSQAGIEELNPLGFAHSSENGRGVSPEEDDGGVAERALRPG